MPGTIIGIFGKQRSGKTLIGYKLTKYLSELCEVPVYTNIYSPDDGFIWINSLADFPLDLSPKIFFLDEIYNGTDAQDYRKLKDISIFLNTIGKQNCLFIYTTIEPSMVYNRLRNQTQVAICVNSDSDNIYYQWANISGQASKSFIVPKIPKLFENVYYDTHFIPLDFEWDMKYWRDRLIRFYADNYGLNIRNYS